MSFSMLPLLLHDADVPETARAEMLAALGADGHERDSHLETAASLIARAAHLTRTDARALLGLRPAPKRASARPAVLRSAA